MAKYFLLCPMASYLLRVPAAPYINFGLLVAACQNAPGSIAAEYRGITGHESTVFINIEFRIFANMYFLLLIRVKHKASFCSVRNSFSLDQKNARLVQYRWHSSPWRSPIYRRMSMVPGITSSDLSSLNFGFFRLRAEVTV